MNPTWMKWRRRKLNWIMGHEVISSKCSGGDEMI